MGKGLPRSLSRGPEAKQEIVRKRIAINETITFTGDSGNAIFGTAVVGDYVEGNVAHIAAVANLTLTGPTSDNLTDDFQGDVSFGTTPADDATLTGADVDIIASAAIPAATSEVAAVRATGSTTAVFDNTDGSLEINMNILLDADEVTDGEDVDITVTGELWLVYTMLGDD
jgi:hypothetical protein